MRTPSKCRPASSAIEAAIAGSTKADEACTQPKLASPKVSPWARVKPVSSVAQRRSVIPVASRATKNSRWSQPSMMCTKPSCTNAARRCHQGAKNTNCGLADDSMPTSLGPGWPSWVRVACRVMASCACDKFICTSRVWGGWANSATAMASTWSGSSWAEGRTSTSFHCAIFWPSRSTTACSNCAAVSCGPLDAADRPGKSTLAKEATKYTRSPTMLSVPWPAGMGWA